MLGIKAMQPIGVYKIDCEDGRRYIIYNAAVIGNPDDHVPDKWYVRPYPVELPLGSAVGEPYETAEDAEAAVRDHHPRPGNTPGRE